MNLRALGMALTVSVWSFPAWASLSSADVEDEVRQILADPLYRFCHDSAYELGDEARDWCSLVDEGDPRCPSFGEVCRASPSQPVNSAEGCSASRSRPGEKGPHGGHESGIDDRRKDDRSWTLSLGPGAAAIARAIFFALLTVFVAYIVYAIIKSVRGSADADRDETREPSASAPPPEAEQARIASVETDVSRLLARARAHAERGDFAPAIEDAYAALLRKLEGDGLIEIHPSRTNGEYVRALHGRPDLQHSMRRLVSDVEGVLFGACLPSRDRFQAIYDRVLPLVGRTVLFCLFLLSCLLPTASCSVNHHKTVRSARPSGFEAFVHLIEKHGAVLDVSTVLPKQLHGSKTLLLLDTDLDEGEWREVIDWAQRDNGSIVAAGRSLSTLPSFGVKLRRSEPSLGSDLVLSHGLLPPTDRLRSPWSGSALELDGEGVVPLLHREERVHAAYRRFGPGGEAEPQPKEGDADEDDHDAGGSDAAPAPNREDLRRGSGALLCFADTRIFENVALASGHDAYFLASLFSELPTSVVLWDASSGRGAANPFQSLHRAHLTPFIVQLLVFFVALLLGKGIAFGRLRDPPQRSSRRFSDHVRALGAAYARGGASGHVVGLYAAWALDRLRERAKLTGRAGLSPIAESLAARTGKSETEVMRVLMEAYSAKEESSPSAADVPTQAEHGRSPGRRREPTAAAFDLMHRLDAFLSATSGSASAGAKSGNHEDGAP